MRDDATAGVIQNEYGYFVGTLTYADGAIAKVSNACHTSAQALEIAERMREAHYRVLAGKERFKPFPQYPILH